MLAGFSLRGSACGAQPAGVGVGLWSGTWEVDSVAWSHERLLRGDLRMTEVATVWETGWGRRVF